MQEGSLVHIVFRLQRDDHSNPQGTNKLYPSVRMYAAPQAIQSTVTRAFGNEERTHPRYRLESQTPHVLQGQNFRVELACDGCRKPRQAAKGESVLVPRERVVGQGHEHALFGQASATVRWLRAQVSLLSFSGAYNWNDALLSTVVRLLLELRHLVFRREEELQNLAPVRCVVNEPGSLEFRKSAIVSGSWEGVASQKQTTQTPTKTSLL